MRCLILICQGDDDQIVPIKDAALKSINLVKNGTLKVYKGAPPRHSGRLPGPARRRYSRMDQELILPYAERARTITSGPFR